MEGKEEDVQSSSPETLICQKPNTQVLSSPTNIEDLLTEILLRVPAQTLTRFKCVLKHWLSLISSPSFCISHANNRSLYICVVEEYGDWFSRYRVQAIKLSDLFSFPDTINPITIYPARSKSKDNNSSVLREVALQEGGDDVPYAMGFCVFRSQITLAGGWFLSPDPKICFAPKPSYVLDTTASEPRFVISSKIPDMKRDRMPLPWLREIEGKLYALSAENFTVLDLITKKWCRLKSLPFPCEHFSFSVLGSTIFATHTRSCITYYFDVKCSFKWTEIGDLFRFEGARNYHDNTLVLDTEDDSEKLMFIFGYSQILVHRIMQHPGSVPCEFELVASVDLPKFPCLSECDDDLSSYSSAHLGDRKVCFSFLYWNEAQVRSLLVLPLEFAYSKSGADFSSTSDQSSLRCTCFRGSFAAKALGYHLFKYDYTEDESYFRTSHLGGCFLLQLHHFVMLCAFKLQHTSTLFLLGISMQRGINLGIQFIIHIIINGLELELNGHKLSRSYLHYQ